MTHLEALNTVLLRKGYPPEAVKEYTQEQMAAGTLPKDSEKQILPGKEEEIIAEYEKEYEQALRDVIAAESQRN